MQAQHSLLLTSFLVLCAIVITVQTQSSFSSEEEDYRGSGRLGNAHRAGRCVEVVYRGSGRMDLAYRGSGRVDATGMT